ncbi:MAG: radical SAM protein, partial [Candidatus Omnitrophica bacterium]|nr:radical SAM protein [Candidatus Omnitrophota bacterium]
MDNLRIDSHKLMYHVPRVCAWLQGRRTYPLYIEIGLYGGCNHRCIFCAFDYLAYAPQMQDERCLKKFITEAAGKGVKSILYSGEGEPLLHPAAAEIIAFTRKAGIDAALATNGVFFTPQTALRTLKNLTWVKVSLDAACARTHALVHGTKPGDFGKAIANIKDAVRIRNKHKLACIIGVQFLLIPANRHEAVSFARRMRAIGA